MPLIYPDHVGKTLLMKLEEVEKLNNNLAKHYIAILQLHEKQVAVFGEIRGMIQAEEFENEDRTLKEKENEDGS